MNNEDRIYLCPTTCLAVDQQRWTQNSNGIFKCGYTGVYASDLLYASVMIFFPPEHWSIWSDKHEYIWGKQDRALHIRADLEICRLGGGGSEKELGKQQMNGRENGLAATFRSPRDLSWRDWGAFLWLMHQGIRLKAFHLGKDLNSLVLPGGWILYLLWGRCLTLLTDSINFRCNANTFSLWLFYKDVED